METGRLSKLQSSDKIRTNIIAIIPGYSSTRFNGYFSERIPDIGKHPD